MSIGKIAIVTDSFGAIGHRIARDLILKSQEPILVYGTAPTAAQANEFKNSLINGPGVAAAIENGSKLRGAVLDYSDETSVDRFITRLQNEHGGESVSVLLNYARHTPNLPILNAENTKKIVDKIYFGLKNFTKSLLPLMKRDGTGRIVNVSTTGGRPQWIRNKSLASQFAASGLTFDKLDALMLKYVADADKGRLAEEGWPSLPYQAYVVSKIGLAAQALLFAKENKKILINACTADLFARNGTKLSDEGLSSGAGTAVFLALDDLNGATGEFWENKEKSVWE
ncbi:hypothetical protein ABW20_dc0108742 [Dactylellina cionopaga]|nr:hypothetical protein ABW20_dc0108742 [Dactylellina cionopaga]